MLEPPSAASKRSKANSLRVQFLHLSSFLFLLIPCTFVQFSSCTFVQKMFLLIDTVFLPLVTSRCSPLLLNYKISSTTVVAGSVNFCCLLLDKTTLIRFGCKSKQCSFYELRPPLSSSSVKKWVL